MSQTENHDAENAITIDVVILSYNRLLLTIEAVKSVQQQQDVLPIIWLIDQGSEDDCLDVLRSLADSDQNVHLVENGQNTGVGMGRNIGMRQGTAGIIVSLDNDAVFADDRMLGRVMARFKEDSSLGAVGFKIENYFTGKYDRMSWAYPRSLFEHRDKVFFASRYCGAGHALRRSAVQKTAMYDDTLFFYWEELDLSYQLISAGYTIIYDPAIVIRHKISPEQRTDWGGKRFYYLVRNAIYLDYKYFRSYRRVVLLAGGYLIKGLYNGTFKQAGRGITDAWRMFRRLPNSQPLGTEARRYIYEHDFKHRGNLWHRLQYEVLERLPKTP